MHQREETLEAQYKVREGKIEARERSLTENPEMQKLKLEFQEQERRRAEERQGAANNTPLNPSSNQTQQQKNTAGRDPQLSLPTCATPQVGGGWRPSLAAVRGNDRGVGREPSSSDSSSSSESSGAARPSASSSERHGPCDITPTNKQKRHIADTHSGGKKTREVETHEISTPRGPVPSKSTRRPNP
eukprot:143520-Amphidinium_carterae.1